MFEKYFNEDFFKALPDDKDEALVALNNEYTGFQKTGNHTNAEYREVLAILCAFLENKKLASYDGIKVDRGVIRILNGVAAKLGTLASEAQSRINERVNKSEFQSLFSLYTDVFAKVTAITYEFSETDYDRIQALINTIRDEIHKAPLISEEHRRRLLRKLEALQQELHRRISDLDRFFGFVALVGIEAGKFGENIKPLTDRVKELSEAVCNVIRAVEGAPSLPSAEKVLELGTGK